MNTKQTVEECSVGGQWTEQGISAQVTQTDVR